jgi:hypothetical protein
MSRLQHEEAAKHQVPNDASIPRADRLKTQRDSGEQIEQL